jgi:hypothetical protein
MASQGSDIGSGGQPILPATVDWHLAYLPDYTNNPLDTTTTSPADLCIYAGYIFHEYPDGSMECIEIPSEDAARHVAGWLNTPQAIRFAHWYLAYLPDYTCCPFDQRRGESDNPAIYTGCIFCQNSGVACPECIPIEDETIAAHVAAWLNECTALMAPRRQLTAKECGGYPVPITVEKHA